MQTNFTPEQLRDPATARSNQILRTCVHCGFCTATCPTYQVLGDELDSPRGRIYLIKDMLEAGRPADAKTVKHIDRCLSLPRLHDHLPVGRALHAPRRPRPRLHRGDLQPAAARPGAALGARADPALSAALPPGAARGPARAAVRRADAGAGARDARARAEGAAARAAARIRRRCSRPRARGAGGWRSSPAAPSGCSTRRINAATIRLLTRHGCEVVLAEGRRLLRGADPSHGQGAREPRLRGEEHRRVDARGPRRRARRDRHQHERAAARR